MASRTEVPTIIVGLFLSRDTATAAVRELQAAGFPEDQIGVAVRNQDGQEATLEKPTDPVTEGATTGAVSGGIVGGLIGLLGSLLIPGAGPIALGGVLASTLAGAGIGAAAGGLIGALISLGVPEEEAKYFDKGVRSGGALVTVNPGAREREAAGILRRHGADLGPTGNRRYADVDTTAGTATGGPGTWGTGFRGPERRRSRESSYTGPERRLSLA